MSVQYIHYGGYDPAKFDPIQNRKFFNKPLGGLWASTVNSENGWLQWNESERFAECKDSVVFHMDDDARVLHWRCKEDIVQSPGTQISSEDFAWIYPDFERLADEYDAIELHLSDNWELYDDMYGWDVDTLLVLHMEHVVFDQ